MMSNNSGHDRNRKLERETKNWKERKIYDVSLLESSNTSQEIAVVQTKVASEVIAVRSIFCNSRKKRRTNDCVDTIIDSQSAEYTTAEAEDPDFSFKSISRSLGISGSSTITGQRLTRHPKTVNLVLDD